MNRILAALVVANMTTIRMSIIASCAAGVLALSACSSSGGGSSNSSAAPSGAAPATTSQSAAAPPASTSGSSAPAATGAAKITIKNFGFTGTLTVKPGEKITVVNEDSAAHTLTDKKTHKFDTGNIAGSGGTGTFTAPTAPGKYPFGCTYHPEMAGTLVVTG
jgi:plastocyanin